MRRLSHRGRFGAQQRKGLELLELAFVLPVIFMILMGILELGRALEVAQILTSAAREGARLGMLYNVVKQKDIENGIDTANEKVTQDIINTLKAAGLPTDNVEVKITTADGATTVDLDDISAIQEEYFRVRVEIPFADASPLRTKPFFIHGMQMAGYMHNATLSGEIIVRHE